jgi:hypothetical protein
MGCIASIGLYASARADGLLYASPWHVDGIVIAFHQHYWASFWLCAIIAHFACCNGDTWASEVRVATITIARLVSDTQSALLFCHVVGSSQQITAAFGHQWSPSASWNQWWRVGHWVGGIGRWWIVDRRGVLLVHVHCNR